MRRAPPPGASDFGTANGRLRRSPNSAALAKKLLVAALFARRAPDSSRNGASHETRALGNSD